jgi:hypothetical protein
MVTWAEDPDIKVEAGATDISSNNVRVAVHRPENAVSYVELVATDTDGVNYIGRLDKFTVVKVSFRYGSAGWTQVFEGTVEKVGPLLSPGEGQTVAAVAYGYGAALRSTHNDNRYGAQISSSLDTPTEIWDDIVDNYVNKSFGGAVTNYALTKTKIKTIASPTIPFIDGKYRKNIDLINLVAGLYTADQAGSASVHWFVDPSKNLWIDSIGAHTVDTANWPTWWRTNQAGSTLTEGVDFHQSTFITRADDFANKVVLFSDLRKPGYDYWTEDSGGAALWGNDGLTSITDDNTADVDPGAPVTPGFIVGSHSVKFDPNGAVAGYGYYPSGASADWDITAMGSEHTIPFINFYSLHYNLTTATTYIMLSNNDTARKTDYFAATWLDWQTDPNYTWKSVAIPIGPYWESATESRGFRWSTTGSPVWTDIDTVEFNINGAGTDGFLLIDDLHFSGKIIREAYNSTSIAAVNEYQKPLHMTVAIDDSLQASDASGTAGMIAYQELLRRQTTPVVGQIIIPLAEDALPGQLIHAHGDEQSGGAFRVDSDMRIKEVLHTVGGGQPAYTTLDVTDDVLNTHAYGFSDLVQTWQKAFYLDPEARNLRGGGVDTLITRLSKDYP